MWKYLLVICLVLESPVSAQIKDITKAITGSKTPPKPTSTPAAAQPAGAAPEIVEGDSSLQTYLEMRAFSEGLYRRMHGSGPTRREGSFKKAVDTEFENLRKSDTERAYQMNVSAQSEVKYVVEDRFRVYSGLYDNPLVQALLNRIGQSLVPDQVSQLYTFKLIADPVPWAEALSTGTVWVSTGLVALMSSKAQLAYVLAHESAHVYLNHHLQRIMLEHGELEYNAQLQENAAKEQEKKSPDAKQQATSWLTNYALSAVTSRLNPMAGRLGDPTGLVAPLATNFGVGALLNPSSLTQRLGSFANQSFSGNGASGQPGPRLIQHVEWNRFEEDAADKAAFDWLMTANMDIEQIPTVYRLLRDAGDRDPRIKLGFLGKTDRIRERLATVRARIELEKKKPAWATNNRLVSDPEFATLLAEIQRDNGVFAFHHDMLESARQNLRSAVLVKTKDPTALYFYAKVLSQTARTDKERAEADDYFLQASKADQRNQNYGAHLHRAIQLLTKPDANQAEKLLALDFLKRYLLGYHFANADAKISGANYPPHLESIYDYMARAGDFEWKLNREDIETAAKQMAAGIPVVDLPVRSSRSIDSSQPGPKTPGQNKPPANKPETPRRPAPSKAEAR